VGTGGTGSGMGTARFLLTDAPACGYDTAFVTVERVRVHRAASAADGDSGWSEVVLDPPQRIDLLTLTNGTLVPLGQTQLPAGIYTQLRLVLSPNTAANPLANAVKPTGGTETALTTPSGQQSGLKINAQMEVPEDKRADFAIDFDACKSFVRAGNSGQILLKPVLAVIPIFSDAGQRIEGWLDPSMVAASAAVSAQASGVPVRSTLPAADGKFVLYPVPPGTYDLVITAEGRANAAMTGVPVTTSALTVIGSTGLRINTPPSVPPAPASGASAPPIPPTAATIGKVTLNGSDANTGGVVRAKQAFTGGPTMEVGSANANATTGEYSMTLPTGAPAKTAYAASTASFDFTSDPPRAGLYRLEATVAGVTKTADTTVPGPTIVWIFP
jgi:hypothetical protein